MRQGLSLEQAPPIAVPLRFFLTLPLFGLIAAALVAAGGDDLLASRWNPPLLALTHLLTLGVLGMVMCGAMFQMLPVVAGAPVARVGAVSALVHAGLGAGVPALALGLGRSWPLLAAAGGALIGAALLVFASAAALALRRASARGPATLGMHLALAGLLATVLLGLVLLADHLISGAPRLRVPLTALHLAWGLIGWVAALVVAVAFQVVPMFQITPEYPRALARWLLPLLTLSLAGWSLAQLAAAPAPVALAWELLGSAVLATFALATLDLQRRRRRRVPDVSLDFWRLGLGCLLAALVLWLAWRAGPAEHWAGTPVALGALLIGGFALSIVNGMLYKIVPFLCWFHLQAAAPPGQPGRRLPGMRELLDQRQARWQLRLHATALAWLGLALAVPALPTNPAGALWLLSFAWLGANLLRTVASYRRHREPARVAQPSID